MGKIGRNTPGDRQRRIVRLTARNVRGYRMAGVISFGQSQVQASGPGSDDAVGNLPGVHLELTESIGSLLGWHKGVGQKNIETLRKIIGVSRKA
ncbi:hypothetical protein B296_00000174 [Ensete ventricosum]|uniref:Uncharacterized protein n=1 Tax=Ensete ventricosum TaxID=4639 RepID=A0A426YEW7_ENSVE|nr:hypothetical protein B296_00000174 [Ensete ventricosum]